jgi:hypothetical protein
VSRRIGAAGGIVALAAVAITAATVTSQGTSGGHAPANPSLRLVPASTLGRIAPPPDAGPLGPEDVPVPSAAPLAPAGAPAPGQMVDGMSSAPSEQFVLHIHAHLTVFVAGAPRQVPFGIGIAPPLSVQPSARGPFAASGGGFSWLHTHASDGIIHVESPVQRTFTLGNLFDVWGQPLGPGRVGPAAGPVTVFFDGRRYLGDPRAVPLLAHAQIQLDVGRPLVGPEAISFPQGL